MPTPEPATEFPMRKRLVAGAVVALGLLLIAWLAFSWFEADKELRVLCSEFHAGLGREHVIHVLETGDFLRYRVIPRSTGPETRDEERIVADSLYNLGTSRCVIELEAGRVASSTYE